MQCAVGEEVDGSRLLMEGAEHRAHVLLAFFEYEAKWFSSHLGWGIDLLVLKIELSAGR